MGFLKLKSADYVILDIWANPEIFSNIRKYPGISEIYTEISLKYLEISFFILRLRVKFGETIPRYFPKTGES